MVRFLKRSQITLQRVRDHKSQTVEERLDTVRDWFLRLDNLQRKTSIEGKCRIADEDIYCCDEFSIVIKPKTTTSYNRKGAEANQVKELQDLASRAASGLITFRHGGAPIGKIHVILPLAPKKIYDYDTEGKKFIKDWDVRIPASTIIMKEMEGWKKYENVIPLFWKSAMAREPVIRAYSEDLLKWAGSSVAEKQLQLDWYDSHTDEDFLTKLKVRGNIITMFYPNRCTDILATCDGGLIKTVQDRFKVEVARMLEDHFDQMTGNDPISKRIQRDFILKTMNEAVSVISTEDVRKIAKRCGAIFELHPSLEQQFNGVKLRGYTVEGIEQVSSTGVFQYRNVFEGFDEEKSVKMRKEWILKEVKRNRAHALKTESPKKVKKKKKRVQKKRKKRKNSRRPKRNRKRKKLPLVDDVKEEIEKDNSPESKSHEVVIPDVKVGEDGSRADVPRPRGGQISFMNRKERTMSLLFSLNK